MAGKGIPSPDWALALFHESPQACSARDTSGRIILWNEASELLFGWRADEVVGTAHFPVAQADLAATKARFTAIIAGNGVRDQPVECLTKDGRKLRVEVTGSVVRGPGGEPVGIVAFYKDVTELNAARSSRRAAEDAARLLTKAIEQSANGVVITNSEGEIEYVNGALLRKTGYSAEELIGRTPRVFKSGDTPSERYAELWRTILAGSAWHGELRNKTKDGRFYWVRAAINPVRAAGGRITHFIGIQEDVTEQKLLQAQFLQAQKMESVGRMASGVAHDFNSLLTVIDGCALMARQSLADKHPAAADIDDIRAAVGRAGQLTRQLLAFSRKDGAKPRDVDLCALIHGLDKMLRRLTGPSVELVYETPKEHCRVVIDPGRLEQVIINLVVNARDAMPNGGKLTLSGERRTVAAGKAGLLPPGDYAVLTIRDSGTGMSAEVLAHAFEPFFTTKEPGRGTGLGLSTCYAIVKQAGGAILLDSVLGAGTAVHVWLPLVAQAGK